MEENLTTAIVADELQDNEALTEQSPKKRKALLKKQAKKLKSFWKDFKTFMSKGNVLNLAVAVIIGTAFTKIVNSLVNDLIMPLFSAMFGDTDLSNLKWVISDQLVISWGLFVLAVIEFLVIALFLFLVIRTVTRATSEVSRLSKKTLKKIKKGTLTPEQAQAQITPPPAPPVDTTESLLKEIRDLLMEVKSNK